MKTALADAEIAPRVAADKAFQNARDNMPHTARMAHDQALAKAAQTLLKDDTSFYQQWVENESIRRSVGNMVYPITSDSARPSRSQANVAWPLCLTPSGGGRRMSSAWGRP